MNTLQSISILINTHIAMILSQELIFGTRVVREVLPNVSISDTEVMMGIKDKLIVDPQLLNFFMMNKGSEIFCGLAIKTLTRQGLSVTNKVLVEILSTVETPQQLLVLNYILALKSKTKLINYATYNEIFRDKRVVDKVILNNIFKLGQIRPDLNYFMSAYSFSTGLLN